ncbi:MAG TPA: histidine--tRNA ligase [Candidatus Acidoferrum sp.]|nr:histidine--tRNA ligase [Candidatus Acidoferrum sp.]
MAQLLTRIPKGTRDVLPDEVYKWDYIESVIRSVCRDFNYREIRTPVFEHTELFERGVGDATDIVQKEMYTFEDKGGRSITLRPEGTSPVVRALLQNSLYAGALPVKLFYYNLSCYRYEQPQAGRLREFHQFGVEQFGAGSAAADAEIIMIGYETFRRFGLADTLTLRLNSIGCPNCRKTYREKLVAYLEGHKSELCPTCKERMYRNPMRVFDCKSEICQGIAKDAPFVTDNLCDDCAAHFAALQESLKALGIPFVVDPTIVRGLDYYRGTVFEFVTSTIGAQGTVCGGGRYDGLIEELGGDALSGIGFGLGLERLLLTLEAAGFKFPAPAPVTIYLGAASDDGATDVFLTKLASELRAAGVSVERDLMGRSVKAQMKYADKLGARYAAIIGPDELAKGAVQVRDMQGEGGFELALDNFAAGLKECL